jgi:hypothetical protein
MTDNERLGKIWNFVESELKRVRSWGVEDEYGRLVLDDYALGMEEGLNEVLNFMDGLMD